MSIKVAHVTTAAMSLRYLLQHQLQHLQAAGYEVMGISSAGPEVRDLEAAGISHIAVQMHRRFSPVADLIALWKLYRLMRRERLDIVHTHTPKPGLLAQIAARLARVPIVINTVHGFYFHDNMPSRARRFYITIEKIAAMFSDRILFQSTEDLQTAREERICPRDLARYLGNGIDLREFRRDRVPSDLLVQKRLELGIPEKAPIVGFVGRLVREKGVVDLLGAARLVIQRVPGVRFLIIGPIDDQKADCVRPAVASSYGVSDACVFTGFRSDMPGLYALMDVLVLPSYREGMPRAPMEAAAMGVPCVVTDVRGCREVVEHGRTGLLVPPGDINRLAEAIIELLTNPRRARLMGERAKQVATQRFDERLVFHEVEAQYAALLAWKGIPLPRVGDPDCQQPARHEDVVFAHHAAGM